MQILPEKKNNINTQKIEEIIVRENAFIKKLFSVVGLPSRSSNNEEDELESHTNSHPKTFIPQNGKPRAQSLTELQERLEAMKGKTKMSYKDKVLKKSMKTKLKKKSKLEVRKMNKTFNNIGKLEKKPEVKIETNEKPAKPVFNSEGKMVFSKFDFSELGRKDSKKSKIKDPKKLLQNLEKQKEKIENLKESGEVDKAIQIKEKSAWKNAMAKASGEKVKDDPTLLKKTIKKREQLHKLSKKKWQARQEMVSKKMEERQNKRQENIEKKKKTKKLNKMKKAVKKGKIIPGF